MNSRLSEILKEIRELENKVQSEMKRREEELRYKVREGKATFQEEILELHKKIRSSLFLYIVKAPFLDTACANNILHHCAGYAFGPRAMDISGSVFSCLRNPESEAERSYRS